MDRSSIKEQFGANAAAYVDSKVHAKGASLARLVAVVQPRADWQVLDIASAAGHTAFAFAPHVAHVRSTDITPEMLAQARKLAEERQLTNVTVEQADAEELPYADGTFDLVTCRIAPHHFGDILPFLHESARVLQSGGLLAVVDNIVPAGPAGDYVNAFEKLRDPSHSRCLSAEEWLAAYQAANFTLIHQEELPKAMEFETWAARHDATLQRFLRALLTEAHGPAADFLQPATTEQGLTFQLREGLFVGRKA